ncbi:hypothetical protein CFC21_003623 [Triticum aestivum]|uniref:Uncharacterized protein n=2 Tax=Triticum TaxID=4564 RepID=A0A9R0V047_TRITD|nr:hypothetical protein CFC21_003623 [Triticum aestivum]VAH09727.1 unnamed protein product [Triticum turgidum subsp. durum]
MDGKLPDGDDIGQIKISKRKKTLEVQLGSQVRKRSHFTLLKSIQNLGILCGLWQGLGMFFHLTYFKYFVGYVQRQRAGGKCIDEQRDGGMEQLSSAYKLDIFDESSPN